MVIIDDLYYHVYCFVNWNVSKKGFRHRVMLLCICWGGIEFRICRYSRVDLILHLFGIYGIIILVRIFDIWSTGVGICEIIDLIGLPCLWVFILSFMYHYYDTVFPSLL